MFTYNAAAPTADRVRLHLGDTQESEGPRGGGRNFADGELDLLLTQGVPRGEGALSRLQRAGGALLLE